MSVTIVSRPSTQPQPTTADNAAGADAGADFANLLVGQLALSTANDPTAVATDPAATKAAQDDTTDATTITAGADPNTTSLLATLALITPPVNSENMVPASSAEHADGAPLSALAASSPFEKAAQTGQNADLGKATTQAAEATVATTATDNTAAKFAAEPIALVEKESTKDVLTDTTANDVGATSHNFQAHTGKQVGTNPTSLAVSTPVRDQEWASDFSRQVVWLASAEKQSAQLTLNPDQLGPIGISVSMDKGNASVSFTSANAEVRDAIETALPKLREMFASAGIELGQTNVGSGAFQQQTGNGQSQQSSSRLTADNAILAADTLVPLQSTAFSAQRGNGLVDLFA